MARVLVVDDDVFIGQLVCRTLKRKGFEAEHATDLPTARAALTDRGPWSHLLTDARLTRGDGVELAIEVRRTLPQTTVVVMTGATRSEAGVPDEVPLLSKPFETAELLAALRLG